MKTGNNLWSLNEMNMETKVVCFGCGYKAKEFIEKYSDYQEIEYFIDNKEGEESWEGYNRFLASEELCKNKFIVVTVRELYYKEIKKQLIGYGLKEDLHFTSVDKLILEYRNRSNIDKPIIKIWFEDFWEGFESYNNYFLNILLKKYRVILDDKNPDYIICSVFGKKALEYDGVRIIFTGENVLPDFNEYDYVLVTEKTEVTIDLKEKHHIDYLVYGSRQYWFRYIFIFLYNLFKSIYLFIKYRPSVIVTTGTHTAVCLCYLGWIFRKKVIFIESFAKRTSPTLSGRIVYPVATTFIVQWKSMLKFYPKAKYFGGIY